MRYARQVMLKEVGEAGQEKLAGARVLVVGAGGLGSPVLTYLAAAGVGHITIVETDTVSESNLNRQFLHTTPDIGRPKGESARDKLLALNPGIEVHWVGEWLHEGNAARIIGGHDAVVDCVDNIPTRLVVGDACLNQGVPLVEGGVEAFYGYVMPILQDGACLRCMGYSRSSSKAPPGIVGCTAGVIGSLQASMCLKFLLGLEVSPGMLTYDGILGEFERVEVARDENCEHGMGKKEGVEQ